MCGRFTLSSNPKKIATHFGLFGEPELTPRYNVAPTQTISAVRLNDRGDRELVQMRWGLVPSWSEGPGKVNLFNARSESAAEKPSFRSAFKHRRCLIPADGFYEWQKLEGGKKQPILFRRPDGELFGFAGLWESWTSQDGMALVSCTILTTAANEVMRAVHDRMPVILADGDYTGWLDPTADKNALKDLLRAAPDDFLNPIPVGLRVNNARFDGPECAAPLAGPAPPRAMF